MPAAGATLPPTASTAGPEWTRPPEPTLRDVAAAADAAGTARPSRRAGVPAALVLGGGAAALVLLALAGWALWGRAGPPEVAPEPVLATPAPPAEPTAAPAPPTPEAPTPKPPAARPTPPPAGTADVLSTPPGATVSVDGRPAGRTPLAGLRLRPGKRRLEIALEGHETWKGTVDVAAGEPGRVEVRLKVVARPAPPPTPEPVDTARVYPNQPGDVDTLAKRVSGSSPSYPADRAGRLKSGERVSVVVRFVVTETGQVEDVAVVESAGRRGVDEVVVSAVRGWRFEPASLRGTRVKVEVTFKQTFLGG
jgi:protein TonB